MTKALSPCKLCGRPRHKERPGKLCRNCERNTNRDKTAFFVRCPTCGGKKKRDENNTCSECRGHRSRRGGYKKEGTAKKEGVCKKCGGVVKPTCRTYDQLICFKCNGLYKGHGSTFQLPKEFKSLRHMFKLPLDKNYESSCGSFLKRRYIGQTAGAAMLIGDVVNLARLDTGMSRKKVLLNMLGEDGLDSLKLIYPFAAKEKDVV